MNLKEATQFILSIEKLKSKKDLNIWCGDMGKEKLYSYVQHLAPEHWKRIKTPKDSIRFYYQKMLSDYKIYK